jgi:putative transposase
VDLEVGDTLDTKMVINAFKKAFAVAKPQILNSYQGCQFTTLQYIDFVKKWYPLEHGWKKPLG